MICNTFSHILCNLVALLAPMLTWSSWPLLLTILSTLAGVHNCLLWLNFPLLADIDHKVAEKYGVWREKNMYGKISMGIQRSTFLIDPSGAVAKVWKKVSVDGHDQQVIDALKEMHTP